MSKTINTQQKRIPDPASASYLAARWIYDQGPKTAAELMAAGHFGGRHSNDVTLQRAISTGWLVNTARGQIACGDLALDHFDGEQKPVWVGEKATGPALNLMTRPPLSTRHLPNPRGLRADVPAWSVRGPVSFRTVA